MILIKVDRCSDATTITEQIPPDPVVRSRRNASGSIGVYPAKNKRQPPDHRQLRQMADLQISPPPLQPAKTAGGGLGERSRTGALAFSAGLPAEGFPRPRPFAQIWANGFLRWKIPPDIFPLPVKCSPRHREVSAPVREAIAPVLIEQSAQKAAAQQRKSTAQAGQPG